MWDEGGRFFIIDQNRRRLVKLPIRNNARGGGGVKLPNHQDYQITNFSFKLLLK